MQSVKRKNVVIVSLTVLYFYPAVHLHDHLRNLLRIPLHQNRPLRLLRYRPRLLQLHGVPRPGNELAKQYTNVYAVVSK